MNEATGRNCLQVHFRLSDATPHTHTAHYIGGGLGHPLRAVAVAPPSHARAREMLLWMLSRTPPPFGVWYFLAYEVDITVCFCFWAFASGYNAPPPICGPSSTVSAQ